MYASIHLMYLVIGMLNLTYFIAPQAVLREVKSMSKRLPGMKKILENAKTADDLKFMFSDEYVKVKILKA